MESVEYEVRLWVRYTQSDVRMEEGRAFPSSMPTDSPQEVLISGAMKRIDREWRRAHRRNDSSLELGRRNMAPSNESATTVAGSHKGPFAFSFLASTIA